MEGCGAEGKILMEYFMQKYIFEHLIEDGEERIFDSEKDAIKYALLIARKYGQIKLEGAKKCALYAFCY